MEEEASAKSNPRVTKEFQGVLKDVLKPKSSMNLSPLSGRHGSQRRATGSPAPSTSSCSSCESSQDASSAKHYDPDVVSAGILGTWHSLGAQISFFKHIIQVCSLFSGHFNELFGLSRIYIESFWLRSSRHCSEFSLFCLFVCLRRIYESPLNWYLFELIIRLKNDSDE